MGGLRVSFHLGVVPHGTWGLLRLSTTAATLARPPLELPHYSNLDSRSPYLSARARCTNAQAVGTSAAGPWRLARWLALRECMITYVVHDCAKRTYAYSALLLYCSLCAPLLVPWLGEVEGTSLGGMLVIA